MFILEAIGDIGYLTISSYFTYTIAALVLPVLLSRLLRTFSYYVKNGDLGNANNTIFVGDGKRGARKQIYDFFNETHPSAVGTDLIAITLFGALFYMVWITVPFLIAGRLIWLGVGKFANHMREQHLKKQEFHRALKGE